MGMQVVTTVLSGNLVSGFVGVAEMASAQCYASLLRQAILDLVPDAEVQVHVEHAEGVSPPTRVYVGQEEDDDLAEAVDVIAQALWSLQTWVVEEESEAPTGGDK